jgi:hypothetical protein
MFYTFFQYNKSKSSFSQHSLNNGHCMGTTDNRMKALHISNEDPYIYTINFEFFSESKRRGGGNEINDQHKISFNKILVVLAQFTTTSKTTILVLYCHSSGSMETNIPAGDVRNLHTLTEIRLIMLHFIISSTCT